MSKTPTGQVSSRRVATKQWHFYKGKVPDPRQFADVGIFTGSANPALANEMSEFLGVALDDAKVGAFADGEISVQINKSVRGKHVYIIQSVCRSGEYYDEHQPNTARRSVNDALMELLLMISACRRASCASITAVLPYYAYARQDRKMHARVPISAADVALMITQMGVNRVVCVDLHCGQIQGFFPPTVSCHNLDAGPVGAAYFSEKKMHHPVVVSPDAGGVARAKEFRAVLEKKGYANETGVAMIIKQRSGASKIERMDLVGDVAGRDCIIVDDMVDTAGTLCLAAKMLKDNGARRVMAFCTHALFSGAAPKRIAESCLDELVVTNTVPLPPSLENEKRVSVLSLAPILAETLRRLHDNSSMSKVFEAKL